MVPSPTGLPCAQISQQQQLSSKQDLRDQQGVVGGSSQGWLHGYVTCAVTWGPVLRRAPLGFKALLSPKFLILNKVPCKLCSWSWRHLFCTSPRGLLPRA